MPIVRIDCAAIKSDETFHSAFAEAIGFPGFYGRNMNAWIDCMSYLDEPDSGMTRVTIKPGDVLTLHLEGVQEFSKCCPDLYAALIECSAFVNWRRTSNGENALVALSFQK